MDRPDIRILPDAEKLCRGAAEESVRLANEAVRARAVPSSGSGPGGDGSGWAHRFTVPGNRCGARADAMGGRTVGGQLLWMVDRTAARLLQLPQ